MIRSLVLGVAMAALLAGPVAAATIHVDDLDDFKRTWFRRWNSTAVVVQEASSVTLSGGEDARMNRIVSREYLSTHNLSRIVLDESLFSGGFEVTAVKFATVNGRYERVGIVSLGRTQNGVLNIKNFDWAGAEDIRLRLVLDADTQLNLDRVEVQASAAPEPSAALLMGLGFLVTGAHFRFRR